MNIEFLYSVSGTYYPILLGEWVSQTCELWILHEQDGFPYLASKIILTTNLACVV